MKILYNSVHSILEYDEVRLFQELGHDVFSLGAYSNGGKGHYLLPRPSIEGMKEYPEFEKIGREYPRTDLPAEFFDNFDCIITMHMPQFLGGNWQKMKHKKVVFRSIGQNTSTVEDAIRPMWYEGMKIVRMSGMEENIVGYVGANAIIPFYKDPEEWKGWIGHEKRIINFTQTLLGRRQFCHYDAAIRILSGFPALIYGSGNEDLGVALNGGELPYDLMRGALRDNRAYLYMGTWPSPVTLSLIESMMTGIPVVAIGKKLAEEVVPEADRIDYYEIPNIIRHGENGFCSDDINELRSNVAQLLEDQDLARKIGEQGRKTAIKLFSKEKIKLEWKNFLDNL